MIVLENKLFDQELLGKLETLKSDGNFLNVRVITNDNKHFEISFYLNNEASAEEERIKKLLDTSPCLVSLAWYEDIVELLGPKILSMIPKNIGYQLQETTVGRLLSGEMFIIFFAKVTEIPKNFTKVEDAATL